jgi:hypothetical protein
MAARSAGAYGTRTVRNRGSDGDHGGNPTGSALGRRSFGKPRDDHAHEPMVGVAVSALGPERDHHVGPDLLEDFGQLALHVGERAPGRPRDASELAVLEAQEEGLLDAQRAAGAARLLGADARQLGAGGDPGMGSDALLAVGDDRELDARPSARVGREQGPDELFVVRMCEDGQDGLWLLRGRSGLGEHEGKGEAERHECSYSRLSPRAIQSVTRIVNVASSRPASGRKP